MRKPFAILTVACFAGACPPCGARPHHAHHAVARVAPAPTALRIQPISYDGLDYRASSNLQFFPRAIAGDRLPVRAADKFGHGGVVSVGYEPGAGTPLVEAHELNAAFSSQPTPIGGLVGGNVSLHF